MPKPHAGFFLGAKLPVLQKMQELGYLFFEARQYFRILFFNLLNFPNPVAGFALFDDNGAIFIIGTQNKLGEKIHLVTVFSFGFHLVRNSGTQVFDTFRIFPAVKQGFIHTDNQFVRPIGIELAVKIFVGVECPVAGKDGFKKIQESGFACIPLDGNQNNDRKPNQGLQVEQLQIIQAHFHLFAENMGEQRKRKRAIPRCRLVVNRLVLIQERADAAPIVGV
jgi:hypothetical protein